MSENDARQPAHELWVEVKTRITLPRQGALFRERNELACLLSLVRFTRDLMLKNPAAPEFLCLAAGVIHTVLPFATRWQGCLDPDGCLSEASRRAQFRTEIEQLVLELDKSAQLLRLLAQSPEYSGRG